MAGSDQKNLAADKLGPATGRHALENSENHAPVTAASAESHVRQAPLEKMPAEKLIAEKLIAEHLHGENQSQDSNSSHDNGKRINGSQNGAVSNGNGVSKEVGKEAVDANGKPDRVDNEAIDDDVEANNDENKNETIAKTEKKKLKLRDAGTALVVLLFSVGVGLFFNNLYQAARQKNIVSELEALGAHIRYETGSGSKTTRAIFGRDFFDNVVEVRISNQTFDDLSRIGKLRYLESLVLDDTAVSDLTPISQLWNLKKLSINECPINDLTPIENLIELQEIEASGTELKSLESLINLNLRHLAFSRTNVKDLAPISHMADMNVIHFSHTLVADIGPLEHLGSLRVVHMDHTFVWDLRPLETTKTISEISLDGAPLLPSMVARLDIELPLWSFGRGYWEIGQ